MWTTGYMWIENRITLLGVKAVAVFTVESEELKELCVLQYKTKTARYCLTGHEDGRCLPYRQSVIDVLTSFWINAED